MSLLVKAANGQRLVSVTPESAGWHYVGFEALRLAASESISLAPEDREVCIIVLEGTVSVDAAGQVYREIGERRSVFEERSPFAVYVPSPGPIRIDAHTDAEVAIARAPAGDSASARLIEPQQMKRSVRGIGSNQRFICDILPETEPAA